LEELRTTEGRRGRQGKGKKKKKAECSLSEFGATGVSLLGGPSRNLLQTEVVAFGGQLCDGRRVCCCKLTFIGGVYSGTVSSLKCSESQGKARDDLFYFTLIVVRGSDFKVILFSELESNEFDEQRIGEIAV
jgi:hypothetical protein